MANYAIFFFEHLLFGACYGWLFDWAVRRNDYPEPIDVPLDLADAKGIGGNFKAYSDRTGPVT